MRHKAMPRLSDYRLLAFPVPIQPEALNGAFPAVIYERMDSGDDSGIDPAFLS
jgi:hypothetical protein